jgi:biotin carboxyl carrier protein
MAPIGAVRRHRPVASVTHHDVALPRRMDPRAVRVALGPTSAHADLDPMVVEPQAVTVDDPGDLGAVVDGERAALRLTRVGPIHATLAEGASDDPATRTPILILPADPVTGPARRSGVEHREVIVDGWRVAVEVESERRAALRDRASRGRAAAGRGGPTEVRAIIPGVVVSVSVAAGDAVVAGQQLLVVEAMKMQNELRAPRDGVILRVAVGAGQTIEVGDLMLVLE